MARLPRLVVPKQAHQIVQTSVDRQPVFRDTDDFQAFLKWLQEAARLYKVAIHAYVLLPDEVHLLATPDDEEGLARMMQWASRHYVPYFNRKNGRSGTIWQGRFRAAVVEAASYLIASSCYLEFLPVHKGLASEVGAYLWSSYAHHAGVRPDSVISDHALYWSLGNTPFEREAAYRQYVEQVLTLKEFKELEESARKGWALGSEAFKTELEKQLNRQVSPGRRGRPRKAVIENADRSNGNG